MTQPVLSVKDIVVGERHRKDMGDLDALVKSIGDVGLLQPIAVRPDNLLVSGERRLEAVKKLGWDVVPVRIVFNLDEVLQLLKAERDENTCRKDFTPEEAVAIGLAIEEMEKPKAKERQAQAKGKPQGTKKSEEVSCVNFTQQNGRTRDKVAEAVGMSGPTYEKAKRVVEAAESDPEQFGPIKEEMNKTGNVNGAFKKLPPERKKAPRSKKNPKKQRRIPNRGIEVMFTELDDPLSRTLVKLKALGKVSSSQFNAAIGDARDQAWFMAVLRELRYMRIVEADGMMELVIDKEVDDLCTLVRKKIIQAHDTINRYNRFKFDIDIIKAAIADLYDAVVHGATV